jgi:hypothetical protein
LSEKHYSGEFRVRIPPELHRQLAIQAAEQGVSLNRLASAKLAGRFALDGNCEPLVSDDPDPFGFPA